MKVYRSDWPETGASSAVSPVAEVPPLRCGCTEWGVSTQDAVGDSTLEMRAVLNGFEATLYQIPCWELRTQLYCDGEALGLLSGPALRGMLQCCLSGMETRFSASPAYVYAKVVAAEPIYGELLRQGFEVVEHRCLYKCRISELAVSEPGSAEGKIDYLSLAQGSVGAQQRFREQMLDVCRESFADGWSRHFRDPYLAGRVAGTDYILAAMRLNFDKVPPAGFLLAVDQETGVLAGVSVLGRKPGLAEQTYTQLLSAVRVSYRGQGIYRGMTRWLGRSYPGEAVLLNVTHRQNEPIRRAYEASGRRHLADTLIVRRVFGDRVGEAVGVN